MRVKTVSLQMKLVSLILLLAFVPAIPAKEVKKDEPFAFTKVDLAIPAQEVKKSEPFTFTKVDLALLEQCNLLDQRFEKEGVVYTDEALNAYLDRVGKSLAPSGDPPERVQWRFRILRDPLENAFAMPNGSIYLHSGMLSLVENESQLASVMAHEMAHVLNRHTYIENRSMRKKAVAFNVLGAAGGMVPGMAGAVVGLIANTAQVFLVFSVYGYRRELEKEADLFATTRLLDSNYDPKEMISMFKLLDRDYDVEQMGAFYGDHPRLQERIGYVDQMIKSYPPSTVPPEMLEEGQKRYLSTTEKITRHDIQLNLDNRRRRTALARGQKLVTFNPNSSENLYYLAEAYRSLGPKTIEPTGEELSPDGRKKALKQKQKFTADEEEKSLMATPLGQSAWKTNQVNAEEQYRKALELDGNNANAHRGLGMLFEQTQRNQQAIEEYKKYLELRPNALDRVIIQRRLAALEGSPAPPVKSP